MILRILRADLSENVMGKNYSYIALYIFLNFISMIMFFFDLFHPYNELEVLWLEMFDFTAAEINNEHIEAAIL